MREKHNLINLSAILLYILPLAILTGPLIPELILLFISSVFIIFSIKEKAWFYFNNNFTYIFIIFCLYLILRSSTSDNPILSLESSLLYCRFGIFSLAIWYIIENKKNFIKNFSFFLFLTFTFAIVDGLYQIYNDFNIFGYSSPEVRMTLTLDDRLYLGGFLTRLFPLLFATLLISFSNRRIIFLLFILFIVTDVTIFVAGERTAIGIMVISTIFIIALIDKYKKIRLISFVLSLIIIGLITINSQEIKDRNFVNTYNQLTAEIVDTNNNENSSTRVLLSPSHHRLFMTAINMFRDKPLFGHGPKLFRELCSDKKYAYDELSCSTHPHNTYLQILAETGVMGFAFLILILVYMITNISKHLYAKIVKDRALLTDYQVCLMCCFFISIWPFFPTQNLFNNWINIIYYLPVGFYLQSLNLKKYD